MSGMPNDPEKRREFKKNLRERKEKNRREALYVTAEDSSDEETEKIARAVLTAEEVRRVEEEDGLTATTLIREKYGVDPASDEYETDADLLAALGEPEALKAAEETEEEREAQAQAASGAKVTASGPSDEGTEAVAFAVLTPTETARVQADEGLTARGLIASEYGVDATNYDNDQALLAAIGEAEDEE